MCMWGAVPSAAGRGTWPPSKQHTANIAPRSLGATDASVCWPGLAPDAPLLHVHACPERTLTALLSAAVTADEEAATSDLIWVLSEASTLPRSLVSLVSTLVILPSGEARQQGTTTPPTNMYTRVHTPHGHAC